MRRCTAYSASKGAVRLFTKSLALEVASAGIRVNYRASRGHRNGHSKDCHGGWRRKLAPHTCHHPMQRMGRPEDIAAMILFLASDEAAYVTGRRVCCRRWPDCAIEAYISGATVILSRPGIH